MKRALLSIKPEYVKEIFSGNKKYEFRRRIFKSDVDTVVIYASSPVKKVVGEFQIEDIIYDDINSLWDLTKDNAGISDHLFQQYFKDKESGFAIKIKNVTQYQIPLCIKKDFGHLPPQSFVYL